MIVIRRANSVTEISNIESLFLMGNMIIADKVKMMLIQSVRVKRNIVNEVMNSCLILEFSMSRKS